MKSTWKRRGVGLGVLAAALVVVAGCHYVGGGTMKSATGTGEAAFSFNLNCPTNGTAATGVLTYIDPAAGVYIHGTASPSGTSCGPNDFGVGTFTGTYTTFKGPHETGTFSLCVTPGRSAPSSVSGATFSITLSGGLDYSNSGPVIAGQIQPIGGSGA